MIHVLFVLGCLFGIVGVLLVILAVMMLADVRDVERARLSTEWAGRLTTVVFALVGCGFMVGGYYIAKGLQ